MGRAAKGFFKLTLAVFCAGWGFAGFAPEAKAQFFWWFDQPKQAPKPRAVKPKPPSDDLPPIVPRESSAPPPPDDRPYDNKLLRLTEILGAIHYLRELCGAQEGQIWRDQMKEILRNEGTTAVRRAKLVNSFNDGYRGFRRTYRSCTQSATLATQRFSVEGANIAASLAQGSTVASKGTGTAEAKPAAENESGGAPKAEGESAIPNANGTEVAPKKGTAGSADQTGGIPDSEAPAPEAAPAQEPIQGAEPSADLDQESPPADEPPE
jgi:uncharacterized protein (TIGR02301 family)